MLYCIIDTLILLIRIVSKSIILIGVVYLFITLCYIIFCI